MQTLVMALRAGRPEHTPEAEPVMVDHDGKDVTLTLDDGEVLTLDLSELLGAIGTAGVRLRDAA